MFLGISRLVFFYLFSISPEFPLDLIHQTPHSMTSMLTTPTKRIRDDPDTDTKSIPVTYHMVSDDSDSDSEEVAPNIKVVDARQLAFKTFDKLMQSVDATLTIGLTTEDDEIQYDFDNVQYLLARWEKRSQTSIEEFDEEHVEELSKFVDSLDDLSAKLTLIAKTGREAGFCSSTGESVGDESQLAIKTFYELMQSVDSIVTISLTTEGDEVQYEFSNAQRNLRRYQGKPIEEFDEEHVEELEESQSSIEEFDEERVKELSKELAKELAKFVDSLDDLRAKLTLIAKTGREAGFCSVESVGDDSSAKKRARI